MRVIEKTLRMFADALGILNEQRNIGVNQTVFLFFSFFVTIILSFTNNITLCLLVIFGCIITPFFLSMDLSRYFRFVLMTSLFLLIITLPTIISNARLLEIRLCILGFRLATFEAPYSVYFYFRALSAIIFLDLCLAYMGWRNIVIGLSGFRIPKKLIMMISFFIIYIPRHIFFVSKRLFARSSRIIVHGVRRQWIVLSSIVGDLFIYSSIMARRFALGLKSRGFDDDFILMKSNSIGAKDIFIVFLLLCILYISIMA